MGLRTSRNAEVDDDGDGEGASKHKEDKACASSLSAARLRGSGLKVERQKTTAPFCTET